MAAAALSVLAQAPAFGQEFDPAFNATTNGQVSAMVLQADGKVVIAGTFTQVNGVARPYIARLNADGSLETSYAPVSNSAIFALALQADGKIVAGGNFTVVDGLTRLALVRFMTDGSVDPSFTPGVNISVGNASQRNVYRLLIEPDGDIIVAGEYLSVNSVTRANIARIDSNGVLDGAFAPQVDWSIYALARQSDGGILIGGRFTAVGGIARTGFARINAGGSLDNSFNPALAGGVPLVQAIAVRPDGRILLGGRFTTCNSVARLRLAQVNANGTLDTTFAPSITSVRSFDTVVRGLALQADGRVVVSGTFDRVTGADTYFVTRLTTSGGVDFSFGNAFGEWAYRQVSEIIIQPDGNILVAGEFGANVARFLGTDPTPVNADLRLTMSVQPTTYTAGGTLQYSLTVAHVGTDVASSIVITDNLPASVTYQSCNTVYTCGGTGNARTFSIPSMLPNETVTITMVVNVLAGQTAPIVNTASVTSLVPDLALGNNTASATANPPAPVSADLGLTAIATPATFTADANLSYTLTLTNAGPNTANTVVVADTLPAGLTYVSCTAPGGTCGGSGSARTVSYASRASGSTSTITIVARVAAGRTVPLVNTATVTSATNDSVPGNNAATVTTFRVDDVDGDGLPNLWETDFGLNPSDATGDNGASGDPDHDLLTNAQEYGGGTHPRGFFHPMLAEGASNSFFDVQIALLNVGSATGRVLIRYLQPGGAVVSQYEQLPPGRRSTRGRPAGLTSNDFATIVESDQSIILDRTMTWGGGYGSHAETGVAGPSTTWFLAEGSTSGDFSLFYLLQNPNPVATVATVRYLLPFGQSPIVRTYALPPNSRTTIPVDAEGGTLAATDVSAEITAPLGIVVERAMYRSTAAQPFAAGHNSAGVTAPATSWFLAEGATGPFFDCFILLANPNGQPATATIDYLLSDGRTFSKAYTVPANGRFTVWVDEEQLPAGSGVRPLANVAVSSAVTSSIPIVVERTMWWPGPETTSDFWTEAHNSPGATATATRWALAEGEVGGAQNAATYILIANTSATPGSARVRLYFEDGTNVERTFALLPRSRRNVNVSADFPAAAGRRFGSVIESVGSPAAAIVVERAMYTSPGGVVWAAGTNALATPIP